MTFESAIALLETATNGNEILAVLDTIVGESV